MQTNGDKKTGLGAEIDRVKREITALDAETGKAVAEFRRRRGELVREHARLIDDYAATKNG